MRMCTQNRQIASRSIAANIRLGTQSPRRRAQATRRRARHRGHSLLRAARHHGTPHDTPRLEICHARELSAMRGRNSRSSAEATLPSLAGMQWAAATRAWLLAPLAAWLACFPRQTMAWVSVSPDGDITCVPRSPCAAFLPHVPNSTARLHGRLALVAQFSRGHRGAHAALRYPCSAASHWLAMRESGLPGVAFSVQRCNISFPHPVLTTRLPCRLAIGTTLASLRT